MRFLLDQGLPRSAVALINARGHLAEHVGDLGMSRAADADILVAARARAAVVVTLDADFHALLASQRATDPSVIRLRAEGVRAPEAADMVIAIAAAAADELHAGVAISVYRSGVRMRRLPLV